MGISIAWIAVQGLDRASALQVLGMELAQPVEEGCLPSGWAVADLPNGWLLVLEARGEIDGDLEKLAAFGPAVACRVSEIVMYSEARGYEGGREVWRLVHDPEEGIYSIEAGGTPPASFESILAEAKADQDGQGGEEADVDLIFDVPARVASSICGFMIGEEEPEGMQFINLRKAGSAKRPAAEPEAKSGGFFARLFGRG